MTFPEVWRHLGEASSAVLGALRADLVWGLGVGGWGLLFRVLGLGVGVQGFRFMVEGLGFGVWGAGFSGRGLRFGVRG